MTTCIACEHWQPKAGDAAMARMGFAPCAKKPLPGHTVSAEAAVCLKFSMIDDAKLAARRQWLDKKAGKR